MLDLVYLTIKRFDLWFHLINDALLFIYRIEISRDFDYITNNIKFELMYYFKYI